MELRNTEASIDDVVGLYNSLRHYQDDDTTTPDWQRNLVIPLLSSPLFDDTTTTNNNNNTNDTTNMNTNNNNHNTNQKVPMVTTATEAVTVLQTIQTKLVDLRPVVTKFTKRLHDMDPITQKPRYGAQTARRVEKLIARYNELQRIIMCDIFGENLTEGNDTTNSSSELASTTNKGNNPVIIETLRDIAFQEEEVRKQRDEEIRQKQYDEEQQRIQVQRRIQDERQQQIVLEQQRIQAERDEQLRQIRLQRENELQIQRNERRRDQEWVANIPHKKTIQGVHEQLNHLLNATANDPTIQANAVRALHVIFQQIVKYPEETNYRRIRRDHPKFLQDIGNYNGGKELLIAAGFELGTVDEIPSYICSEPNIEHDMDGWSTWFDLLKNTFQLLQDTIRQKNIM